MATIHPHSSIDFFPRQVDHAPSPLGFGFGLASSSRVLPMQHTPSSPSVFHVSSTVNQPPPVVPTRVHKRRLDSEEDAQDYPDVKDVTMDRSPTPERARRTVPKRARMMQAGESGGKDDRTKKDDKGIDNDVDVGMLLASLPQDSLLPLLRSLIETQPTLKPLVLSMIPRPSVDAALNALALAAKKLRDAYPYSSTPTFGAPAPSTSFATTSFGFGSGFGSAFPGAFGASGFSREPPQSSFVQQDNTRMRDDYIVSRLAPHVAEFISASLSYLPYFSYLPSPNPTSTPQLGNGEGQVKPYPHETYRYLSALTTHVLSQPPLARSSLVPILLPRLLSEWNAWIDRIDRVVNTEGGMFGRENVLAWERSLDEYSQAKEHGLEAFRQVRDKWVLKVGWLVGRTPVHAMDEEL